MTPSQLIRPTKALVLVLTIAALALPGLALAGSSPGRPAPDVFERYVAAHPFGAGTVESASQALDWFDRYAAAHPFGHRLLAAIAPVELHRTVAKPGVGLFVDDWFRDPSSVPQTHHTTPKPATGPAVDDWFRDPR